MKVEGIVKRWRQRQVAKSVSSTMRLYERTLESLVRGQTTSTDQTPPEGLEFRLRVGNVYGFKCPDDPSYYRTAFIKTNPFTGQIQPLISNPIYGEIPSGIQEVTPQQIIRQLKLPDTTSFNSFGKYPSAYKIERHQDWSSRSNTQGDEE